MEQGPSSFGSFSLLSHSPLSLPALLFWSWICGRVLWGTFIYLFSRWDSLLYSWNWKLINIPFSLDTFALYLAKISQNINALPVLKYIFSYFYISLDISIVILKRKEWNGKGNLFKWVQCPLAVLLYHDFSSLSNFKSFLRRRVHGWNTLSPCIS